MTMGDAELVTYELFFYWMTFKIKFKLQHQPPPVF